MPDSPYVTIAIPPLKAPLTYRARGNEEVGFLVSVPLGRQHRMGWVVQQTSTLPTGFKGTIKEVHEELEDSSVFDADCLRLFQWCSDYYCYPLSEVIDTALPKFVSARKVRHVSLVESTPMITGAVATQVVNALRSLGGSASLVTIERQLNRKGLGPTIKSLSQKGVIVLEERLERLPPKQVTAPDWAKRTVALNSAQQQCVDEIQGAMTNAEFVPFLLYGVTGSGKTEVYIEAILRALAQGKSALIVVPEIALTPQLVDRFRARLSSDIAILHSGLSARERWENWMAIARGTTRVALGARSAVFAPLKDLGLIIVDEEHETSFKQQEGFRYNARDVAIVRAQQSSCPIVLGSATPSLEAIFNVARKRFRQLTLPQRHSSHGISSITVIDMSRLSAVEKASPSISLELLSSLQECVFRGEQAFIFYNKRGFSSYLQCDGCGSAVSCHHCSITLTYHKGKHSLLCHLCGLSRTPPEECPSCKAKPPHESVPLIQCGSGTERVMEELISLLPDTRIARLDRDTADSEASYRAVLDAVRSGETQILVGTQMLAKGHDLPLVTLVGVVDADVGLHLPDFRASERVFQLLTQVSGRAGRGEHPGKVIIQTRQPRHPSITFTEARNYFGFAALELKARKELSYPPFSYLVRLVVSSPDQRAAGTAMAEITEIVRNAVHTNGLAIHVLGPSPAPLERVKSRWRFHCLLKSPTRSELHRVLQILQSIELRNKDVRLIWDVDPYDML